MADYLIKRPMLLSAVASSIVCITGFYSKSVLVLVGILIIILLFLILYYKLKSTLLFSLLLVFAVLISTVFQIKDINRAVSYSGNSCKGEFIVIEEPELLGDYYRTVLEVEKSEIFKKGDKLSVIYSEGNICFSQHIIANISLKDFNDSPYKASNYSEKIYSGGFMKDVTPTGKTDFVLEKISNLRKYIEEIIFENYNFPEAATVLALITGNRDYFTDEFYSNLKASGVTHIMVVSGMHLSVIVSVLLYFVNKIFYNRYLKALVIFIAVLLVFGVCGFTMSIMRAGITYILIAISLLIDRPNTPSNSLGAAVTIILINNPFAIFNVAFQLSVLSTFGILAVAIPINSYVKENELIKSKILFGLFSCVLISVSAAIMTAPVVIYYFGYISNLLIITNLLVCYPSTVTLIMAIIGLAIPVINKPLFYLSELIIKYINGVINYFGSLPFAVTYLKRYTAFLASGIIIAILLGLLACKNHIDMLKLKKIYDIKIKEGGKWIKWR